MTKPRLLSAGLALALALGVAPVAFAQDDAPLGEDPTATEVFDSVDPVDITEADLNELSILLEELQANIDANSEAIDALSFEVVPEAALRIAAVENRANNIPDLRARLRANNVVTKAAVRRIVALQQQVNRLSIDVENLGANVRGLNAAVERLGESPCTGPTCAD